MSVKKKIRNILIAIISIGIILSFVFNYYLTINFIVDQLRLNAVADILHIESLIENSGSFDILTDNFDENLEVVIVDDDYNMLFSSNQRKNFFFSSDVFYAKKDGESDSIVRENILSSPEYVYSKKSNILNKNIIIRCKYSIYKYGEYKKQFLNLVFITLFMIASIVALLVSAFKREYKRPLKKLVKTTSSFNPSVKEKIKVDSNDSTINDLVTEFNNLIDNYNSVIEHNDERITYMNSFLSNLNIGIIVFGKDGNVRLLNKKVEELLKIKRSELFVQDYLKDATFNKLKVFVDEIVDTRKNLLFDFKLSDTLIVEIEGLPFFDKYNTDEFSGVVLMIRDVTKLRNLETIQKEFVSNVSHELKTPLAIISGYAQTLNDDRVNLDENEKKVCLNSIYKETGKLSHLISKLLEISRISENRGFDEDEFFDPFVLVDKTIGSLRERAKLKNIIVVMNTYKRVQKFMILNKPMFFLQILNNLVDNAIKYSYDGSKIVIEQITVDDFYILKVIDRGLGIPKDDLDLIFNRFYRVEKSRNSSIAGSGLGLAIAKELVIKFKGKIKVESAIGEGSTFTVSIPLYKGEHDET
ncbi:MAG: sensor histidine kinase [Sphaerochaeta sp.]